ncbi:MAG: alanine racemase [Phaeodactylibacter sp.]|nr:alanine racemase [Phaeodactylibacter sp.]
MVKHSSRILLSQSALKNNINFLRKKIGSQSQISAVVKANAYGHGIAPMTKMLERCGISHFSTASAHEAEEVLEHCSAGSQVMIMGILYDADLKWAVEHEVEFFVFNFERLPKILEVVKATGKVAKVHLELETGTNRTGMTPAAYSKALGWLKRNAGYVAFQGLCTHLGGAENSSNAFKIKPQIEAYFEAVKLAHKRNLEPKYRHLACSAAALAYPETRLDLVRIGVSIYGFWPSPEIYYQHLHDSGKFKDSPLKRIITWKTDVMDVKTVKKGEFIGYGTSFQALKDMTVAVLPLGYSNGYARALSNRGYVLIKGIKAPIVGLINMNLFMVDISHIPGVEVGAEVVLLGKQRHNVIKVSSFTNSTQLLNTEMLCRLPAAIPREIVK